MTFIGYITNKDYNFSKVRDNHCARCHEFVYSIYFGK